MYEELGELDPMILNASTFMDFTLCISSMGVPICVIWTPFPRPSDIVSIPIRRKDEVVLAPLTKSIAAEELASILIFVFWLLTSSTSDLIFVFDISEPSPRTSSLFAVSTRKKDLFSRTPSTSSNAKKLLSFKTISVPCEETSTDFV